jgi:hypothetical protein
MPVVYSRDVRINVSAVVPCNDSYGAAFLHEFTMMNDYLVNEGVTPFSLKLTH